MKKCCYDSLTAYIVQTAKEFSKFSGSVEDFARWMIEDAGVSMDNEDDAEVIMGLGHEYVSMMNEFNHKNEEE